MTSPDHQRARPTARIRLLTAISLVIVAHAAAVPAAAQTGEVRGQVIDRRTEAPVRGALIALSGSDQQVETDSLGAFHLSGLRAGRYTLRVTHLAYGERSVGISVVGGETTRILLTVTENAIALAPLSVAAVSVEERRARGAGYDRNVVTRAQLTASENTHMDLADILRQHAPTVRVRRMERIVGSPVCIELRTIRSSGVQPSCLSPAVYLDGVPITNPTMLYSTLDPRMIESIEVIPAAESGVRFGSGALYGALLIETRRPGGAVRAQTVLAGRDAFDWASDESGHSTPLVLVSTVAANAAGLAVGLTAARQCLSLRAPSHDSLITDCEVMATLGAGVAAMLLPALSSSLASRWTGRTDLSQGRFVPALVGAGMTVMPGYALALSGQRNDSDTMTNVGYAILVVGTPLITTAADYLFRRLRGGPDDAR
jgi:hypothetical protein